MGGFYAPSYKVDASGNSNMYNEYNFSHREYSDITYYRLLQYDNDGEFRIYGPISIVNERVIIEVSYYNLIGKLIDDLEAGVNFMVIRYSNGDIETSTIIK